MRGKSLLCALSAGGPETAYRAEGYNHFTLRELLRPLEQTANLTGMRFLAPFALFGARTAVEDGRIGAHTDDWRRLLLALRDDRVDLRAATDCLKLNDDLDRIIQGAV